MQWDTLEFVTHHPTKQPSSSRAQAEFASDALLSDLAAATPGELSSDVFSDYLAFYQLPGQLSGEVTHKAYLLAHETERLVVQHFVPCQPVGVVMVCHGYYDHVGLYGHLIEALLQRRLTVVSFDQPGHGLSTGPRADIGSFDEYVAVVTNVFAHARQTLQPSERPGDSSGNGWHWLGQSMGGAIVMEYLHQTPGLTPGEVILLAPLVRPYAWWLNRWVFAVAKRTITERPRVIAPNADNPEFYNLQLKDPLAPHVLPVRWVQAMVNWFTRFEGYGASTLAPKIVQGYADRTVSWRHSYKTLSKRYPAALWHLVPNGQHHVAAG